MDFTKDADPSGVKALLAQLRNSQAFNEVSKPPEEPKRQDEPQQPTQSITERLASRTSVPEPSPVAALLAKLRPNSTLQPSTESQNYDNAPAEREEESLKAPPAQRDFRKLTVQQALPQLHALSSDAQFIDSFKRMKEEQNRLEQKLWDERALIVRKHEERLKNARAKAALIRASASLLQEETKLKQAMDAELKTFHIKSVFPAWDVLAAQQQDLLERLSVPAMFVTNVETDRARQQRIMQMLESIVLEGDGEEP